MNRAELIAAAKKSARRDARGRKDPRYRTAVGVFLNAGLLSTNADITPSAGPVALSDVLWAGKLEPRLLELLPAVLIKRPALVTIDDMPEDLQQAVRALRNHLTPEEFRGIPGEALAQWVPRIGHRNKLPSRLKSFRLRADDLQLLHELADTTSLSETEVLRAGLRALRDSLET